MALADVSRFFGAPGDAPAQVGISRRSSNEEATREATGGSRREHDGTAAGAKVVMDAIRRSDLDRVGRFLHEHHDRRITAAAWAEAANPPWMDEPPNHGFMLSQDGRIVGVHLALYSRRWIDGRPERFCDLAAWCVLETHRIHGLRLLRALLAQAGFHFTDLSPSGNVIALNERLGFRRLDTATLLAANLPWWTTGAGVRIHSDPSAIASRLTGESLKRFRDHRGSAVHQILVQRGDEVCHVMYRLDRRKKLKLFALLLHIDEPGLFRETVRHVLAHMLLRHGAVFTLIERQVVDHDGLPGLAIRPHRPRMVKSDSLAASQIDYLYSEISRIAP